MDFKYTTISLNDVYRMSYEQALENIRRNGGTIEGDKVNIKFQSPATVAMEQGFPGMYPIERRNFDWEKNASNHSASLEFDGTGIVITGKIRSTDPDFVGKCEFIMDGKKDKIMELPAAYTPRSDEMYWKYQLDKATP